MLRFNWSFENSPPGYFVDYNSGQITNWSEAFLGTPHVMSASLISRDPPIKVLDTVNSSASAGDYYTDIPTKHGIFKITINISKDPHWHRDGTVEVFPDGSVRLISMGAPWKEAGVAATIKQGVSLAGTIASLGASAGFTAENLAMNATEGADMWDSFESFDFSDGDAWSAVSDAQNVDYGFGINDSIDMGTGVDFSGVDVGQSGNFDGIGMNGTAESNISDFGSVDYGFTPNGMGDDWQIPSVQDIAKNTGRVGDLVKTVAGGGSKSSKGQQATPGQAIAPFLSSIFRQSTAVQKETTVPKTYKGQLTPTGGATGANPMLLLAGAALVAVSLFA